MDTTQERIARGIARLDERAPGWREKVDLGTLDMSSMDYGLLEQVTGGEYRDGLKLLSLKYSTAAEYGFDLDDDDDIDGEDWAKLTDAWIHALSAKEVSPTK